MPTQIKRGPGHPRKIATPGAMAAAWEEYKAKCDNHHAIITEFSQRQGDYVTKSVNKPIIYSIVGFCGYIGLAKAAFYEHYDNQDSGYADTVSRIRTDCEADAARKFEAGQVPTQLAGVWMGNFGWGVKQTIEGGAPVVIVDDVRADS